MSKAPEQRCTITVELWLLAGLVAVLIVMGSAHYICSRIAANGGL